MAYSPSQSRYSRQRDVYVKPLTQSWLINDYNLSTQAFDNHASLPVPSSSYSNADPISEGYISQDFAGDSFPAAYYLETPSPSVYGTHDYPSDVHGRDTAGSGLYASFSQTPSPMEHVFTRINTLTDDQIVDSYVRDVESGHGNMRYFACKYSGCTYPVAFCTQREAVQHVHYAHLDLGTQAFVCITCGAVFVRKQDAVRHVKTMNEGKKYVCGCWSADPVTSFGLAK